MGIFSFFKRKPDNTDKVTISPTPVSAPAVIRRRNKDDIPSQIEDYKEEHFRALRHIVGSPVGHVFSGMITLEVNIPKLIKVLVSNELIATQSMAKNLLFLKADELKAILRTKKLKVSGNKPDLVDRINSNFTTDEIKALGHGKLVYVYTESGEQIVESAYEKFKETRESNFRNVIELILSNKIEEAYKMICKDNAEKPLSPELGVNWAEEYRRGLSKENRMKYNEIMKTAADRKVAACAIYAMITGYIRTYDDSNIEGVDKEEKNTMVAEINRLISVSARMDEIRSYKEASIEKYQFTATFDKYTCSICGDLDGKIINIADAKQGVNLPPMHDGCRCATRPYFDYLNDNNNTKWARNPVTGESFYVPSNMTYKEWSKKYLGKK